MQGMPFSDFDNHLDLTCIESVQQLNGIGFKAGIEAIMRAEIKANIQPIREKLDPVLEVGDDLLNQLMR
jgi:hypothetical protein